MSTKLLVLEDAVIAVNKVLYVSIERSAHKNPRGWTVKLVITYGKNDSYLRHHERSFYFNKNAEEYYLHIIERLKDLSYDTK